MALRHWRLLSFCLITLFFCFTADFITSELVYGEETINAGGNASEVGQVSISSTFDKSWCIAKDFATPDSVLEGLDWVCGFGGADCQPIQPGGACFLPNTVYGHASYAFNSYYQTHQHAPGTCDFDGVATVTYEDPSYSGCTYPFRAGQFGIESKGRRRCTYVYSMLVVALLASCVLIP